VGSRIILRGTLEQGEGGELVVVVERVLLLTPPGLSTLDG
jgi:hypothetical protein